MRGKELDRALHIHRQQVADGAATPLDLERLTIEAQSAAALAQHFDVRQKAHLDGARARALAFGTAAAAGVEREAAGAIAAHARLAGAGKQRSNVVPEADVGGRARARCASDRSL